VKKFVPLAVVLFLLFRLALTSQTSAPVLAITNNNGKMALEWTGGPDSPFSLQATTDLSRISSNSYAPITWTELSIGSGTGSFSLPATTNQQRFFRLAPMLPIFQYAIFYNMDLEIATASVLNIQGPVFSDGGLWSGSTVLTFASTVSAAGVVTNSANDPFCAGYNGSGKSTYLLPGQPVSNAPPLSVFSLNDYTNPAAAEAFLNLPPTNYMLGTSNAFSASGQLYLANKADLFVTNYSRGTNWGWSGANHPLGAPLAVYYQDAANAPNYLAWVTNDFYVVSNSYLSTRAIFVTNYVPIPASFAQNFQFTNGVTTIRYTNTSAPQIGTNVVLYMGYSFLTNVLFYDWREGWNGGSGPPKKVYAVQLDLQAYNNWMTNTAVNGGSVYNNQCLMSKAHPLDSIYIYNNALFTPTTLPAVRVMNGKGLPPQDGSFGFTLATPMPLYVLGDYNATNTSGTSINQNSVIHTEPAALMADAITVLSDNWVDTNNFSKHTGGPSATQTTINTACLEGIVPSNTNNLASNANGYSGGVENFLRLLENWSSVHLWYNGSIVVMFPSQYATNCWQQNGNYYTAASRFWAFNTNFLNAADLPPLTPTVVNYVTP
jgi:hypothetical protein